MKIDRNHAVFLALAAYANEPCRICGEMITMQQVTNEHVVFAGYSSNNEARSTHKECWDKNIPMSEWKYQ